MKVLRHCTLGALFGSILVFSILSYWCVGLRVEVERTINYYMSSSEHNVIIINSEEESKQIQEPLILVPRESFVNNRYRLKNNPYHRRNLYEDVPHEERKNFNSEPSVEQQGLFFLHRNYTRYKLCDNCFKLDFDFLTENDICGEDNYTLVYLVFTKYSNVAQRTALRKTWLSDVRTSRYQTYIFVSGTGSENENFNIESMIKENDEHKDILLVDFLDSYSNLTYKTVMAFKWVVRRCPQAQFVMKVDDDVWVHKPPLMRTLLKTKFNFGGYCMFNSFPFRNKDSKYYASFESFPERLYPPFCSGTAYLTKINVIRKILSISPNVPFFHLEDVYIALCLRELGIGVSALRGFNAQKIWSSSCLNKSPRLITSHGLGPDEMKQVWSNKCDFQTWVDREEDTRIKHVIPQRKGMLGVNVARQAPFVRSQRASAIRNYFRVNKNINKMTKGRQGPRTNNRLNIHVW